MITAYFFGSSIRMPPIFTNSASTPSTFMELIFSTSAGGNVFSIPKMIPIFFATVSPQFVWDGHSCPTRSMLILICANGGNLGQNQNQHQLQLRRTRVSDLHDTKSIYQPSAAKEANHACY